jgi:GNAT superfamily N-acetyltransferase
MQPQFHPIKPNSIDDQQCSNHYKMTKINFRSTLIPSDPDTIENIVRSTGFFYEDEIPIARELAEETLVRGIETGYQFLFADFDGVTLGYAAYGHVDGTDGTYDLYWIAVQDSARARGIGKSLLEEVIKEIEKAKGRQLIAETSSLEKYEPTRAFYLKNGFVLQAAIPDFFRLGDSKLFYVYKL